MSFDPGASPLTVLSCRCSPSVLLQLPYSAIGGAAITAEVKRGELMRFYVKQVESAHVNKFSHMSDEELEAFIRDGVAGLDGVPTRRDEDPP